MSNVQKVFVEWANYHPCTSILIEGLKRLEGGSDVLEEWDRARAKSDTALAQQPAAVGVEGVEAALQKWLDWCNEHNEEPEARSGARIAMEARARQQGGA